MSPAGSARPQRAPHRVDRSRDADRRVHLRLAPPQPALQRPVQAERQRRRVRAARQLEPPRRRAHTRPHHRLRRAAAIAFGPNRCPLSREHQHVAARRAHARVQRRRLAARLVAAHDAHPFAARAASTSAAAPSCARRTPRPRRAARPDIRSRSRSLTRSRTRDRVGARRHDRRHARQRRRRAPARLDVAGESARRARRSARDTAPTRATMQKRDASAATLSMSHAIARRRRGTRSRDLRRDPEPRRPFRRCGVRAKPVPRPAEPLPQADLHLVAQQPLRPLEARRASRARRPARGGTVWHTSARPVTSRISDAS